MRWCLKFYHRKAKSGKSSVRYIFCSRIQPLTILQKSVVRQICGLFRLPHTFESFKKLQILPLKHMFYFKVLKIFFKKSGYLQSPNSDFLHLRSASSFVVSIPSFRSTHFKNSYTIVSCRLFYKLSVDIRCNTTLSCFVQKVKLWLFGFNHE